MRATRKTTRQLARLLTKPEAVMREREDCAQVAELKGQTVGTISGANGVVWQDGYKEACREVAYAIRTRTLRKTDGAN